MAQANGYKFGVLTVLGAIGGFISELFGGWDSGLVTFIIFTAIDYITGVIVGILQKSPKSENGSLDSRIGFKGLCKKGVMLLMILIAVRLDLMTGSDYIRDAVIIGLSINELVSIVENAGLIGVPIPAVITKVIDILKSKNDEIRG
jgi:toxin secretion/phage lysis holin